MGANDQGHLGDLTQPVPDQGHLGDPGAEEASTGQTGAGSQTTGAPPPPESSPLTRKDAEQLFREQLSSLMPELARQFATREDLDRSSQRASDKRFAALMRNLAPEMRGIDRLVKTGVIDEQTALAQKQQLFIDEAAKLGVEEGQGDGGQASGQFTGGPLYAATGQGGAAREDPQVWASDRLEEAGLGWPDVAPDLQRYLNEHPDAKGMPRDQAKQVLKLKARAKYDAEHHAEILNEAVKVVEGKSDAARKAAAGGGATPPPGGAPAKEDISGKDSSTLYTEAWHDIVGGKR